jgi:rhomboid protease GluP
MWLVGFSTLGMLIHLRQIPLRHSWPMLVGIATVIFSFLTMYFLAFSIAGFVTLAVWFLTLALPTHLSNRLFQVLTLQHYTAARRLLWWLRLLQPTAQHRQQYMLYNAYQQSRISGDDRLLASLTRLPGNVGMLATLLRFRFQGNWQGVLDWMKLPEVQQEYSGNIVFLQHQFQALTEVFGPRAALLRLQQLEPELLHRGLYMQRTLMRAQVLAYAGYRDQLEHLLTSPLRRLPWAQRTFLYGISDWAQGHKIPAHQQLQRLEMGDADPCYVRTLSRHLLEGHAHGGDELRPADHEVLRQMDQNAEQLATDPWGWRHSATRCWAAYAIIGLNTLFFLFAEWQGGTMNPEVLMRMGSLWPEAVANGEYWRLITSNFLHMGVLHLALNMYFLFFLAGFLEPRLGRLPFALIYLASGLIAGAISCVWYYYTDPYVQSVGASGSVLGLLGAFIAIRLQAWLHNRELGARRQLTVVIILLSLQVFYDLITPISNGLVHLLGTGIGFALTYLWISLSASSSQSVSASSEQRLQQL